MKIYIAASYPRLEEAQKLGLELENLGYDVNSYWHQGEENEADYHSATRAIRDMHAVEYCDLFIELIGDNLSKGGRSCELGMAIAFGKNIILIGENDNCIFTYLPWLAKVKSVSSLLRMLK
jgi:hypothetical protein